MELVDALNHVLKYSLGQEEASFHQALHDNPRDYTPLLVYADWLQENGHEGKARLIREHARNQPFHDAIYDSPEPVQKRADQLAQWRAEVRDMRMDRDRNAGQIVDPDNYPEPTDINHPIYSINGDHELRSEQGAGLAGGVEHRIHVGKPVGNINSLALSVRSKAKPDRWFHYMTGFMPQEKVEEIARQAHAEGVPVEDHEHNLPKFLA